MIRLLFTVVFTGFLASAAVGADEWIDLLAGDQAKVFQKVDPQWHAAKAVMLDPANPRKLVAEEGAGALFKGVGPRMTWIGIGGGIFFPALEACKSVLVPKEK